MKNWLTHPLLLLALCAAFLAWLWQHDGPAAVAIASPLVGAVLARPLIHLASGARHRLREAVWLPVHGQHYVFKGTTVRVAEDDAGERWVCLADVRRAAPVKVGDATFRALFDERCQAFGQPPQVHLRADALVEYLARSNDAATLRLRSWVRQTVEEPARRRRLGHRD